MSIKNLGNVNVINDVNIGGQKLQKHLYRILYISTTPYSIDSSIIEQNINNVFLVDTTSESIQVTLPDITENTTITICKNDNSVNTVTVLPNGTDIIKANGTINEDYGSLSLISIDTTWNKI